jgi:CSLREA domain-containing protein
MSSRSFARLLLVLPMILAATVLLGVAPASAATFTVTKTADTADGTCDADCSLREAIIAANTAAGPDTIVVPPGTYVRTISGTAEELAANGDLDITADVEVIGSGALTTIIEGNDTASGERVFDVQPGAILTMSGVTITRGFASTGGNDGGGISADGTLVLRNAIVTGNHADDFGGGIDNDSDGISLLQNSLIVGNDVDDEGGGLGLDGPMTISNVTVSGNSADTEGGGVSSFAENTFTNVTISGNTTLGPGGGYINSNSPDTINNVTIVGNSADTDNNGDEGGGIYNDDTLTIRNSIVANNVDSSGGSNDCFAPAPLTSTGHNLVKDAAGCTGLTGTGDIIGQDPLLGPLADNGGFAPTHALVTGSPAIGNGDPAPPGSGGSACEAADQRGVPRSACDIGAYELVFCKGAVVNRIGTDGNDTLVGTSGSDGFLAFGGKDTVKGLGGKDTACLGAGNDTAAGGGGKDRLFGEQGKDRLKGLGGNDRLVGGPGKDTCIGGPGKKDRANCEVKKSVP